MLSAIIDYLLQSMINRRHDRREAVRRHHAATTAKPDRVARDGEIVIGETVPSKFDALRRGGQAAEPEPVILTRQERLRQCYCRGLTGCGKSTMLNLLFDADVAAGNGAIYVDWRGDGFDGALRRLAAKYAPDELKERLVLVDLRRYAAFQPSGGDAHAVGFNALREAGLDAYASAYFVLDLLDRQFDLGVQTAELMRNLLLALTLSGEGGKETPNLIDVERMLTSEEFRVRVLRNVSDPGVLRFFSGRFPELAANPTYVSAVLNKLSPLLSAPNVKRLVGMREGSLSFRKLFDKRPDAIVLVCLAADELHSGSGLIGCLIIAAVAKSLMRADRPLSSRTGAAFLYLDETQNFEMANRLLAEIISEGRRYSFALLAAHQSACQLEHKFLSLLRNVVGTQAFFALGADADALAGELPADEPKPIIRNMLSTMPTGQCLLLRPGKPVQRVKIRYEPPADVPDETVAALRKASLERWGRPIAEIDAAIEGTVASAESSDMTPGVEVREVAEKEGVAQPAKPRAKRPKKGGAS